MRKYTVTEYEQQDYDDYRNNITVDEVISNLKHINRGYIGDYDFTGEADDFERYKLHASIYKAIELLEQYKKVYGS